MKNETEKTALVTPQAKKMKKGGNQPNSESCCNAKTGATAFTCATTLGGCVGGGFGGACGCPGACACVSLANASPATFSGLLFAGIGGSVGLGAGVLVSLVYCLRSEERKPKKQPAFWIDTVSKSKKPPQPQKTLSQDIPPANLALKNQLQ